MVVDIRVVLGTWRTQETRGEATKKQYIIYIITIILLFSIFYGQIGLRRGQALPTTAGNNSLPMRIIIDTHW
jgi:hypothetical protein